MRRTHTILLSTENTLHPPLGQLDCDPVFLALESFEMPHPPKSASPYRLLECLVCQAG
jgi:hypothetical protein